MILAVASGKGCTGKTMVATNLALSVPGAPYIDCDVEEPDGHIFLNPRIREHRPVTVPLPQIPVKESCAFSGVGSKTEKIHLSPFPGPRNP